MINETFISLERNLFAMFNKRGQVTVFVILGIILVAVVGFLLYMSGAFSRLDIGGEGGELFVGSQVEPIREKVRDCVSTGLSDSIPHLLAFAGYFELNEAHAYRYQGVWINKLVTVEGDEKINRARLRGAIEDDLADVVLSSLEECDFSSFENAGVSLSFDEPSVSVSVLDDTIRSSVSFPIDIGSGDGEAIVSDYVVFYPTEFGKLYDSVLLVANSEVVDGEFDTTEYNIDPSRGVEIFSDHVDYPDNLVYWVVGEESRIYFAIGR